MIADQFHYLYNKTFNIKSAVIAKSLRLILYWMSNILIPAVYFFYKGRYSLGGDSCVQYPFIVSLTSFPARINNVHLVVESLLRQTVKPDRIILWLSKNQFDSELKLPKKLLSLKKHGLEIEIRDGDLRSYKKYWYVLKEIPNSNFVIVDDDIFYPSFLLHDLIETAKKYQGHVCANRCTYISENHRYSDWKGVKGKGDFGDCVNIMPTGCGGVYYPANSLSDDALHSELFEDYCKDADDIWLNCMAFIKGTKFAYTGSFQYYLGVYNFNNDALYRSNVDESKNDERILSVRAFYKKSLDVDVFDRN